MSPSSKQSAIPRIEETMMKSAPIAESRSMARGASPEGMARGASSKGMMMKEAMPVREEMNDRERFKREFVQSTAMQVSRRQA